MKKTTLILCLFVLLCSVGSVMGQTRTYSESFTGTASYGAGSPQFDNWITFRASLTGTYIQLTLKGSNDPVGKTVTNATIVNQIATALKDGTTGSWVDGGNTWDIGTCGSGIELSVNSGICSCTTGYTIRPNIGLGNDNWGGINGPTCHAASQTIEVIFSATPPPPVPIAPWTSILAFGLIGLTMLVFVVKKRRTA